ncbi:hypothetical protein GCM10007079_12520 [Nocardiopsis terrae]|uniref:Uncharacterized protein n=1 Tax=Nocardiopsis terrae TaxID=372655 RepID=A0ABR9HCL9_9ACTN|nr:hypothetical protein [Nocardiopsis terrae]MBE1456540.1 hypothetical protein [Nocardiopsis terrae]GHC76312.1 hypothetical protein GCM10007079_12520 [Nocardiopsis terrae]
MVPARTVLVLALVAAAFMALLYVVTGAPSRVGQAPEPEYGWQTVDPDDPGHPFLPSPPPVTGFGD